MPRAPRTTAALAIVASVLAACSGQTVGNPEQPVAVPTETVVHGTAVTAAATTDEAPPLAQAVVPSLPETVEVVEPDFLVELGDAVADDVLAEIGHVVPVRHAAAVATSTVRLSGMGGDADVEVMVVDPADFRPLTPEVTAQSVGVWERLAAGEAVLRHDVAHELELELGGSVALTTEAGTRTVRIGAFAANGTPPVAAALIPWSVAADLGLDRPTGLVIAVDDEHADDVEETLGAVLGSSSVQRRTRPVQQTATMTGGSSRLEPFSYTDLGDGTISIDPAWVSRYIRTVELPGLGTTRCHEIMIPQLFAALEEIQLLGLYDHFKPEQFGGCWYPRHIDWDPDMPLSNHAWGIAIDFNTHDNWLGDEPMMDMRVVEVFERWGFEWGGRWRRPDGMHFELDRIVQAG